jgi:hypothetical protein
VWTQNGILGLPIACLARDQWRMDMARFTTIKVDDYRYQFVRVESSTSFVLASGIRLKVLLIIRFRVAPNRGL